MRMLSCAPFYGPPRRPEALWSVGLQERPPIGPCREVYLRLGSAHHGQAVATGCIPNRYSEASLMPLLARS